MIPAWWAVVALWLGGAMGFFAACVLAAGGVAEAKRAYWHRRLRLMRKRRAQWAEWRARKARGPYDAVWTHIEMRTYIEMQSLKAKALNPPKPPFRSADEILCEAEFKAAGYEREIDG